LIRTAWPSSSRASSSRLRDGVPGFRTGKVRVSALRDFLRPELESPRHVGFGEFPRIYPGDQGTRAETGSPQTASTAIQSPVAETLRPERTPSPETPRIPRGFGRSAWRTRTGDRAGSGPERRRGRCSSLLPGWAVRIRSRFASAKGAFRFRSWFASAKTEALRQVPWGLSVLEIHPRPPLSGSTASESLVRMLRARHTGGGDLRRAANPTTRAPEEGRDSTGRPSGACSRQTAGILG